MSSAVADSGKGMLIGRRLLVVEDSFLAAAAIKRALLEAGAEVLGPVPSVKGAMEILEHQQVDAAVLDVNLGVETSERVADWLHSHGLPVLFVTGYASAKMLAEHLRSMPRLTKPVEKTVLWRAVVRLFGQA